jgi:hypothetical protein
VMDGEEGVDEIRDSETVSVAGSRFRTNKDSNNSRGSCSHGPFPPKLAG